MKEVNLSELARVKGVSRKAVYTALQSGRITRNLDGKFYLEQTLEEWERNTHPLCGGNRAKPQEHAVQADIKEQSFSHPSIDLHLATFETAAPLLARKLQDLGIEVERIHQILLWTSWIQMEVLGFYLNLEDKNWIPLTGILAVFGDEERFTQWLAECNGRFEREGSDQEWADSDINSEA